MVGPPPSSPIDGLYVIVCVAFSAGSADRPRSDCANQSCHWIRSMRPAVLPAPVPGDLAKFGVGRIIIAHINCKIRFLEDAGIFTFQPMIKPTHGLVAPLDLRLRPGVVRHIVVPRPDHGLHGRPYMFQHPWQAVAITIVPTADVITRHLDFFILTARRCPVPERPVTLLPHVRIDARLYVESDSRPTPHPE